MSQLRADWKPWPAVLVSCRADASTERDARGTPRVSRANDTCCGWSRDIPLHRVTSHKQRPASDPGSVLGADKPRPIRVPPDRVRVPVKAATWSPREKKSYGEPDSKKREAGTVPGRKRAGADLTGQFGDGVHQFSWGSGSVSGMGLPNSTATFLDVDDDVRLTQIFGETSILAAKLLDFFFHRICVFGLRPTFLGVRASREFLRLVLASNRSAATSTDLRGEAEHRPHLVWQQRPRPRSRCVVWHSAV